MDLSSRMRDALCNCFGQADAFLNTFIDGGTVAPFSRDLKCAAIKVKLSTDVGPDTVAGHAFVCVLESGSMRICQAFYDDKEPFKHTHTLTKKDTRRVLKALSSPRATVRIFKQIIPQLKIIFEKDDVISVDIECIRVN